MNKFWQGKHHLTVVIGYLAGTLFNLDIPQSLQSSLSMYDTVCNYV